MERIEPKRLMPKELEKPEEPEGQKPKLLVVEDEEQVRKFITRALKITYEVHTAKDADEAKRKLEEHGGMAILSDYNYPGGGLKHLLSWMWNHEHEGIRNSPIAGMSGGDFEDLQKFGKKHGLEVMRKPFRIDELAEFAGKLIEKMR